MRLVCCDRVLGRLHRRASGKRRNFCRLGEVNVSGSSITARPGARSIASRYSAGVHAQQFLACRRARRAGRRPSRVQRAATASKTWARSIRSG